MQHFLRFELSKEARASISAGSLISLGLDHEDYRHRVDPVSEAVRESLYRDLACHDNFSVGRIARARSVYGIDRTTEEQQEILRIAVRLSGPARQIA